MDPDPVIFVSDLQGVNKNIFLLRFFGYYFLIVHLHHFSNIKSHKTVGINVFLTILLMIEGSGAGFGSVSISLTNGSGCGSGRPKNLWSLRIRISNVKNERTNVPISICKQNQNVLVSFPNLSC
jgi:hypothetical protein